MGLAIDTIAGDATNPGATLTAVTAAAGDSFAVRSYSFEQGAYLLQAWRHGAAAGVLRVRSPRMHDNAQGLRLRGLAADPTPLVPPESRELLYPQDTLTVEVSGGAAEQDLAVLLNYYRDLPGIDARLSNWEDIGGRIEHLVGVEVSVIGNATIGDWGPGDSIVSDFDQLRANVDYAILGYEVDVVVAAVAIRGTDTGNLRVGGPGTTDREVTRDWFVELARRSGFPCIPVFNAANADGTLVDIVDDAASTAATINFVVAQLRPL